MASAVTLRCKKVLVNPLLQRKQMVIEILHPGRPNVPKAELREKLGKLFKQNDLKSVFVFGLRTTFGGGKSTGFALVYNNQKAATKYEPAYRLRRNGFDIPQRYETGRKQRKERKNRLKKFFATQTAKRVRNLD
mmetsp:Transcript_138312/g.195785  ORF Transcript_138312/g.195785 Transcript_138312/m.195785 type:complete len:134 (-) Transcript_138312:45-446(-)